ncbi:hypothetical protein H0H92_014785 [Tricholoma furcatifolium]|nr:hypothetical protein H0H92_014785 [Tricholoma furcatifolium]
MFSPLLLMIPRPSERRIPGYRCARGGPNGLVAVLILLNWWGLALRDDNPPDARSFWERTVADVTCCIEKIVATPTGTKRKRGAGASQASKRAKK